MTAGSRALYRLVGRGVAVIRHDLALRDAGLIGGETGGLTVANHHSPEFATGLAIGLAIECHRSARDSELVCEVARPGSRRTTAPQVRVWRLPVGTGPVAGVRWRF